MTLGPGQGCSTTLSGTSLSSSLAAGVIALTLEAKWAALFHTTSTYPLPKGLNQYIFQLLRNSCLTFHSPLLTWRDVQHIIVRTSKAHQLLDPEWHYNGAGYKGNIFLLNFRLQTCFVFSSSFSTSDSYIKKTWRLLHEILPAHREKMSWDWYCSVCSFSFF